MRRGTAGVSSSFFMVVVGWAGSRGGFMPRSHLSMMSGMKFTGSSSPFSSVSCVFEMKPTQSDACARLCSTCDSNGMRVRGGGSGDLCVALARGQVPGGSAAHIFADLKHFSGILLASLLASIHHAERVREQREDQVRQESSLERL